MRSLNKKVKALFLLISFAAYMPISIAPSLAADIAAGTAPVINSSINGGDIGFNGNINVGNKNYQNFEVHLKEGAGAGAVGLFDWKTFDVGSGVAVNWVASQLNQKFINRVMNSGKASEIYGALTSSCATGSCGYNKNASVILINPNGITFGSGSRVNLNSFTASTRDIKGLDKVKEEIFGGKLPDKDAVGININSNKLAALYGANTPIVFDKSSVDSKGNGVITLDGAKFNVEGYYANGEPKTQATSVALIGDKININKSEIQTFESNSNQGNFSKPGASRSNVKLITADSVELQYSTWGNISDSDKNGNSLVVIDGGKNADGSYKNPSQIAAGKTSADYGITINDSDIYSGAVNVTNAYKDAKVKVEGTTLWGRKLHNATAGDIYVESKGDIDLINSRLETMVGYNDDKNNGALSNFGEINVIADGNINIDNTRIASAPSNMNDGLAYGADAKAGNITIRSNKGDITIQKSAEAVAKGNKEVEGTGLPINIASKGNLRIESDYGTVKTDLKGTDTQLVAVQNFSIGAKNLELNGGNYISQRGNVQLRTGTLVESTTNPGTMDILGGGIKINDAVLFADKGTLIIEGLKTTIANSTLDYGELSLYNDYYTKNKLNHDVLIKDGTTFYDRKVENGTKDTLVIETTGQLIFDHTNLEKADFTNVDGLKPTVTNRGNQTANVKLSSTQSQVSIRNNSNITAKGNIELNGKTNANVSTSDVTSTNGNITMIGGTKVTLGNAVDQIEGDKNVITKKGSTLTAKNGNIKLWAKGDTKDPNASTDLRGVTILHSKLDAVNNDVIADNGYISVQSGTITASNNNNLTASNGEIAIQKHDCANATPECPDAIKPETSVLTAGNTSTITAKDNVTITKSTVKSANANTITSQNGKTYAQGAGALIQSTNGDVTINQALTANLDNDYNQAQSVKAGGNINFNVKGANQNINASNLNQFVKGNRLTLNAKNNINLNKTGSWSIEKTDLIAGNTANVTATGDVTLNDTSFNSNANNINAKGNVTINNDMAIKKGTTKIEADNNVKTNASNGTIKANGNKLIVNAKKDIDIAFTGVNNKSAGLVINDVNTSNSMMNADKGNSVLAGRNVTLNAKDKTIAIAKVKADTLTIKDAENTKLLASTEASAKPNAAVDNIGPNTNLANVGTAYIEVKQLNGWNMDADVDNLDSIPGFYKENYDKTDDGRTQRHFVQFNNEGSTDNFLVVYKRTTEACDPIPENPGDGPSTTNYDPALRESSVVRLPRHEEGVSAVAPVLNEITDPTANVIMAAARITLDEENENDEEDAF